MFTEIVYGTINNVLSAKFFSFQEIAEKLVLQTWKIMQLFLSWPVHITIVRVLVAVLLQFFKERIKKNRISSNLVLVLANSNTINCIAFEITNCEIIIFHTIRISICDRKMTQKNNTIIQWGRPRFYDIVCIAKQAMPSFHWNLTRKIGVKSSGNSLKFK